jgi:hypothetical protein
VPTDDQWWDLNVIEFSLDNFRMPWSTSALSATDIKYFPNADCSGDPSIENTNLLKPRSTNIKPEDVTLTSSDKTLCYGESNNVLSVTFFTDVGLDRSGTGEIMLRTPSWYTTD